MISWEKEKSMRITLYSARLKNLIHIENNKYIFMNIGINIYDNDGRLREYVDIFYDLVNVWEKLNDDKVDLEYKINGKFEEIELCERLKNIEILQYNIAINLVGVRNTNMLIALLNNIIN